MKNSRLANFPSLYSHKGTPVRIVLGLSNGEKLKIEPLKVSAGGLSLKTEVTKTLLPDAHLKDECIGLIGHDGNLITELPLKEKIEFIRPMVVYPDGSTWEGEIVSNRVGEAGLLVWSWELGRKLSIDDSADTFQVSMDWEDVPTTVVFFENLQTEGVCGCFRNHHACPVCGAMLKPGDDETI